MTTPVNHAAQPAPPRLGEELPVFCERCGYSLHGLPAQRCEHCEILHHRCPECGHTQPINTLRPAFQGLLGRFRAAWLVLVVLIKLNFFGWLLFAWLAMGAEWSYHLEFDRTPRVSPPGVYNRSYTREPRPLDIWAIVAFASFAVPFGLVSRLWLLRWRRSYLVGGVLAVLVTAAIMSGAWLSYMDWKATAPPLTTDMAMLLLITALCVELGAIVAWPLWVGVVRLLMPRRTADALLSWQQSNPNKAADLARA